VMSLDNDVYDGMTLCLIGMRMRRTWMEFWLRLDEYLRRWMKTEEVDAQPHRVCYAGHERISVHRTFIVYLIFLISINRSASRPFISSSSSAANGTNFSENSAPLLATIYKAICHLLHNETPSQWLCTKGGGNLRSVSLKIPSSQMWRC